MPPLVCRGCANRLPNCNAGVDIFSQDVSSGLGKETSIRTGLELITGITISDADGLPGRLCTDCNNKLQQFIAFRTQLITSLKNFQSPRYASAESEPSSGVSCRVIDALPTPSMVQNNSTDTALPESKQEESIEPSMIDQKNKYNPTETRCVRVFDRISVVDEDVESEIDVCSGEDDGVLELDVQCKKNEIYEIESSGESDIQICDYEPSGL